MFIFLILLQENILNLISFGMLFNFKKNTQLFLKYFNTVSPIQTQKLLKELI